MTNNNQGDDTRATRNSMDGCVLRNYADQHGIIKADTLAEAITRNMTDRFSVLAKEGELLY